MYRTTVRSAARPALRRFAVSNIRSSVPRRFASTASPADKPRTWKSSAVRWGLAAGALYYYNTSSVFAEEPPAPALAASEESDLPTVDSVIEQKRREISSRLERTRADKQDSSASSEAQQSQPPSQSQSDGTPKVQVPLEDEAQALEDEAGHEGAFNPETGEINWDCPCLGGMAHGPCGEEFKTAFSCFVYSNEEPKGMDCIEKFQGMQDCFRKYPEIYGAELADEEEGLEDEPQAGVPPGTSAEPPVTERQQLRAEPPAENSKDEQLETDNLPGVKLAMQEAHAEEEDPIPTKWEDATAANKDVGKDDEASKEKKQ